MIRSIIATVAFILAGLALSAWSLHRRHLRAREEAGKESRADVAGLAATPAEVEGQAWADISAPKDERG
jgi:hypothetical protein